MLLASGSTTLKGTAETQDIGFESEIRGLMRSVKRFMEESVFARLDVVDGVKFVWRPLKSEDKDALSARLCDKFRLKVVIRGYFWQLMGHPSIDEIPIDDEQEPTEEPPQGPPQGPGGEPSGEDPKNPGDREEPPEDLSLGTYKPEGCADVKACVDALVAKGMPEDQAWAICKAHEGAPCAGSVRFWGSAPHPNKVRCVWTGLRGVGKVG